MAQLQTKVFSFCTHKHIITVIIFWEQARIIWSQISRIQSVQLKENFLECFDQFFYGIYTYCFAFFYFLITMQVIIIMRINEIGCVCVCMWRAPNELIFR